MQSKTLLHSMKFPRELGKTPTDTEFYGNSSGDFFAVNDSEWELLATGPYFQTFNALSHAHVQGDDGDASTGSNGNDTLTGSASNDTLTGGEGDDGDTSTGSNCNDILVGGNGNDVLIGGIGNDTLTGGAGNDTLTGGEGRDTFNVDSGTDTITDWGSLIPRTGNVHDAQSGQVLVIWGGYTTTDTLSVSAGATALITGNDSSETIAVLEAANAGTIIINGDGGNDKLGGSTGTDIINGGTGNDLLVGGAGNDILTGGAGNDLLDGGNGSDTFNVDAGNDTITDWNSTDTLNVSSGATAIIVDPWQSMFNSDISILESGWAIYPCMYASGRSLYFSVADANNAGVIIVKGEYGNDELIGSTGRDSLIGGSGSDTLIGGAGDDTLIGGIGATGREWPANVGDPSIIGKGDLLSGGEGSDVFVFDLSTDTGSTWATADTITDFASGVDNFDVSTAAGTNSNFVAANGSGFTDEASTLVAAQSALDGTTQYYLAYNVAGNAYLYYDADGRDGGEAVIKLSGLVNATDFHYSDII
jgi:Ca2+-binding RTX toxin-like protein